MSTFNFLTNFATDVADVILMFMCQSKYIKKMKTVRIVVDSLNAL